MAKVKKEILKSFINLGENIFCNGSISFLYFSFEIKKMQIKNMIKITTPCLARSCSSLKTFSTAGTAGIQRLTIIEEITRKAERMFRILFFQLEPEVTNINSMGTINSMYS